MEVMVQNTIIYEQPLNESMRICLRLEHLFQEIQKHIEQTNADSSRTALSSIVKMLDVINRPDLKSKLTQTLTQYASTLSQLEQIQQINPVRLRETLYKLDQLAQSFHGNKMRIGERLRNNDFLNQIRLRQNNPGGASNYSSPAYALWLMKPAHQRIADLKLWFTEFSEIQAVVNLILFLSRNSNDSEPLVALNGFYQRNLDPTLPCEMIRIEVPVEYSVFPEFSVGKHRLAIHFLKPNFQESGRAQPIDADIEFKLTCCRV